MSEIEGALTWTTTAQFGAVVRSETKILGLFVSNADGKRWTVVGVETPNTRKLTLEGVFDQHGHEIVGSFDSPSEAFSAAEAYARTWRAREVEIEGCGCKTIEAR
jgi:hypothetical protein